MICNLLPTRARPQALPYHATPMTDHLPPTARLDGPERAGHRPRPRRRPLEPADRRGAAARRRGGSTSSARPSRDRPEHPLGPAPAPRARRDPRRDALLRRPLRMEYALSADGRELAGALHLLADWGSGAAAGRAAPPRGVRDAARGALALPDLRAARGRRRAGRPDPPLRRAPPVGTTASGSKASVRSATASAPRRPRRNASGCVHERCVQPPSSSARSVAVAAADGAGRVVERPAPRAPARSRDAPQAAATSVVARVWATAIAVAPGRRTTASASPASASSAADDRVPRRGRGRCRSGGSTNASGCPGSSARRRAISAAARTGAAGLLDQPVGERPDDDRRRRAGRRAGRAPPRAAASRAPGRRAWPGRTARPRARSRRHDQGPGRDEHLGAGAARAAGARTRGRRSPGPGRPGRTTISRIGSAMTMSIRSKAATTAWSGAASAGASVMIRT